MIEQVAKEKEQEVLAELDSFAELPDAPPKRKFRLSWVGYCASAVVAFWLIICLIGPSIAPFHEMDMEGDDSFLDAYTSEEGYGTFHLGTDYLGRDTLSRILFGARNTIGISLAATLLAYLMGITLGILAAVKGHSARARSGHHGAGLRRSRTNPRRGHLVDHPCGSFTECRDAAGDRFRSAPGFRGAVHIKPQLSRSRRAAARFRLGQHGARKFAGTDLRLLGLDLAGLRDRFLYHLD
jgi:hypothetical protein